VNVNVEKVKDDNRRTKEAIPLKIEEVLKLRTLCHEMLFCENASKISERSERTVKIFYSESSLFIGVRGVVQENRLDMTIAGFPEDACILRRSEGDVFLLEFKSFCGIVSSESTCFPEGLVLGNSGKILHPQNVGLPKFTR
jgi:hypothetical protein